MADKQPAKKRVIKKTETVREKAQKATTAKPKRRVLRSTAGKVSKPLRALKPLARPFQVKPVRKVAGFIGRILWPRFFREAWQELRLVTWPSRKETWRLATAVFVFALVFGAIVAVTDYGLDKLFKNIILK